MEDQERYRERKAAVRSTVKQYMYYGIIGFTSLITLCFLPMLGSEIGLKWNIPTTTVGWIVFVAMRLIVAAINVLIFHSFMEQAKINVKEDPRYKEALDILITKKEKKFTPRSPKKWNSTQYGKKGVMIFITSALATVALSQAILKYDWVSLITYLITIIFGIILGILQMKNSEDYWTYEFWQYAKLVEEEQNKVEVLESNVNKEQENLQELARASLGEPGSDPVHVGGGRSSESVWYPGRRCHWEPGEPSVSGGVQSSDGEGS